MALDIFDEIDYYDDFFSFEDLIISIPLRYIRDAQNPFDIEVTEFIKRYRFCQQSVKNVILPLVRERLQKPSGRGSPVSPELQVLICLRFYATASFQIVCGDLLSVSQPAVSNIISKVSKCLAILHSHYIKYPSNMQQNYIKFSQLGKINNIPGLSGIDGAIDCTHIKIISTPGVVYHEAYRNRKSYFSINIQAVAGPNGEFFDIVARWAGSTHDSRIFQMSTLKNKYEQGIHRGKLIGDRGYPCLPYLLTPINPPSSPPEEIYNKVQAKTRNIVERMFGQWKRRFPCLSRGLGNKLSTVSNIIVACAVLHNIGISLKDTVQIDEQESSNVHQPTHDEDGHNNEGTSDGFALRRTIINSYTTNY